MRHFLKETDFSLEEAAKVFSLAKILKEKRATDSAPALHGQSWGLLFFKNSTRTRISFDVGIHELGGHPLTLDKNSTQLSRGESVADTAKVLSRYLHGLVIRCHEHEIIEEFAREGSIPVVNALTDFLHPCQIYTDAFTMAERWAGSYDLLGSLRGKKIAFLGDTASNMAHSWILGAHFFGMKISLAGPEHFHPSKQIDNLLKNEGFSVDYKFTTDAIEAAIGADVVYTDVWVSMGDEEQAEQRRKEMAPYCVNDNVMKQVNEGGLFMHCLPAHPGEEVSQEVLDSEASVIFDQAENRLHVQKAILALLAEENKQ